MLEIIKNYENNKRMVYEEPPVEIYDEDYFKKQCGGHEIFNSSCGTELDDVRRYVLELFQVNDRCAAIDIGCGRGELVYALVAKGVQYVAGIDLSQDAVSIASKTCEQHIRDGQVTIQKMSATQLYFADNTFDVAYMTDIVEHLSDANLKQAISEAHRILKPGGRLIIHTLPTVNFKIYGQYITKYYFHLTGKEWFTPTGKEEVVFGHVNIQSQASLETYLQYCFESKKTKVFYAPVNSGGLLKKVVSLFGAWKFMSPHLWAIAIK